MKSTKWMLALMTMGVISAATAEPLVVKIGSAAPKTGGIAILGIDNENGAQLAVDDINAKGDLMIGGQKVVLELVGEDDAGDPKQATVAAQKLVDAGVVAVVGHLNSGASIPANLIYADNGMVQVSPSSTNPDYTLRSDRTPQGYVSAYRVIPHDAMQPIAMAQYLAKYGNIKRIAVWDDSTQYGSDLTETLADVLKDSSITVVNQRHFTDRQVDFSKALTDLKKNKVDAIYWGGMDDVAATLKKQLAEKSMKVQLLSADGACTDRFIELSGRAANGLICSQGGIPLSAIVKGRWFNRHYQHHFDGLPVQIYAPQTYDAVYTIVQAMKIANSTDRESIAAAMPKVDFEGITGRIRFDPRGDIVNGPFTIFEVQNRQLAPKHVIRVNSADIN